ncbi:MAG TPA: PEP-CTERM sorting domain-containing protein [Phycisphaerae bacterium]|nr:PEP-CTERM sorting domain-containing protein [Phycisphaerae bacterium]HNU44184.1 PEP-CTERM sorting domain-containing protein [Phycisphaerae bacterium]
MKKMLGIVVVLAWSATALADWGYPLKWDQFDNPDPHGRKIESWWSSWGHGQLVADDFLCTQAGWLNEIRVQGANDAFNLGARVFIYADVPATAEEESHPGALLKFWNLGNADPGDPHKIGWWDAGNGEFRINLPEDDWFYQEGSVANPIVYWVGVQPKHDIFGFEKFYWSYRDNLHNDNPNPPDIHNLDDAVVGNTDGSGNWQHLGAYYVEDWFNGNHWQFGTYTGLLPDGWRSVDMEFQVYGTPEPASLALLALGGLVLLRRR